MIQGIVVDEKYLDQNNRANLEVLYNSVITAETNIFMVTDQNQLKFISQVK